MQNRPGFYGQVFAAVSHALLIIVLSAAVVRIPVIEEDELVEAVRIEIGQQIALPPETAPLPSEPDAAPPVGEVTETPSESEHHPSDDPSLIPPMIEDLPKPMEYLDDSKRGLQGEPRPEANPNDPRRTLKGLGSVGTPELLGIPIEGDTVFLIDLSGSMSESYHDGMTRYEAVIAKLADALSTLRDTDTFDIVAFSQRYPSSVYAMWGNLRSATPENIASACDWLNGLVPDGGTPTYEALLHVCSHYDAGVENLILVTDGIPNSGTEKQIIDSIERWLTHFTDVDLLCISVASEGLPFVKRLVDRAGGAYVLVD